MIDMVSRSLRIRMTLLASFALVSMTAMSVCGQDPFSLEFKSSRPLPGVKKVEAKNDEPKNDGPKALPEVVPPVVLPPVVLPPLPPFAPVPAAKKAEPARPKKLPTSPTDLVELTASVEPARAGRGELVWLVVRGQTKPFAHTYSALRGGSQTRFKLLGADGIVQTAKMEESPSKEDDNPNNSGMWIQRGSFWWKQQLLVATTAKPGPHEFEVEVKLQTCTEEGGEYVETCILTPYPPIRVKLDVSDAPPVAVPSGVQPAAIDPPTDVNLNDLGALLIAAFGGAIFMLLTPCVFPMIPITVNYFIKQSEKEHHRPFFMASIYAGSIIALLTVVILVSGNAVIQLARDPWFNLGMGVILILFGFGLFGLFDVDLTIFGGAVVYMVVGFLVSTLLRMRIGAEYLGDLPLAILSLILAFPLLLAINRLVHLIAARLGFEHWNLVGFLSKQEARGGIIGACFMATTFTVTSFSCTGPFLGILLAPIANARPPIAYLVLAALVYAATFAAPFFVLALFPTWLKKLPKSGGWMTTIKVTMGFLEIGAALKFLSNTDSAWFPGDPKLFNYDTIVCAWIALSIACSLHLFGIFRLDHDDPQPAIGPVRMIFATIFLGLALYLSPLLFGIQPKGIVMDVLAGFAPINFDKTRGKATGKSETEDLWYNDDYSAAWATAKKENKLIFIDFTGQNCAACRTNELNVFPLPEVENQLKKFVRVKLYTDRVPTKGLRPDEADKQGEKQYGFLQKLAKDVTLPTYVIIDPDRKTPFDGDKIRGRLVDKRGGAIFDIPDFVKFLGHGGGAAQAVQNKLGGDVLADRGR
jgi:thiol:disulfide interchange protein